MSKHVLPKALVVSCIDFRFQGVRNELRKILEKDKIDSYDLLCLAGGAKNLASHSKIYHKKTVIDNIGLAIKLHKVKFLILCNHIDCGAYGGSQKFKNLKEEIMFLRAELKKAENAVKNSFPSLKVKSVILKLQA